MADRILNFLLIYDSERGELVETRDYGTNVDAALEGYRAVEQEFADNRRMDIVLVGSDSIDTVMVTHANYFNSGIQSVEAYLRGFMDKTGVAID